MLTFLLRQHPSTTRRRSRGRSLGIWSVRLRAELATITGTARRIQPISLAFRFISRVWGLSSVSLDWIRRELDNNSNHELSEWHAFVDVRYQQQDRYEDDTQKGARPSDLVDVFADIAASSNLFASHVPATTFTAHYGLE